MNLNTIDRILKERVAIPENIESCWNWTGKLSSGGYAQVHYKGKQRMSHRVIYEAFVKRIPSYLQADHLCRNRRCVNPFHIEPVTQKENIRRGEGLCGNNFRKTHCKRRHEFTNDNTIKIGNKKQWRQCRECDKQRVRIKKEK